MDVQQWMAGILGQCPKSHDDSSMDKKNKGAAQLPGDYFKTPFPPIHNPLIGALPIDTLHNVHDAMSTLQELTIGCKKDELVLSEYATGGLFTLLECTIHALRFELYHRK